MSKKKRARSEGLGLAEMPTSLADAGDYMTTLADRSEEISGRIRSAADFVNQLADVEAGVRSGARRVFRLRTLVVVAVAVGGVLVVRMMIANQQQQQQMPPEPSPVQDETA